MDELKQRRMAGGNDVRPGADALVSSAARVKRWEQIAANGRVCCRHFDAVIKIVGRPDRQFR